MIDISKLNQVFQQIHLLKVSIGKVSDELTQITLEVAQAEIERCKKCDEIYTKVFSMLEDPAEMANQVFKCSTFYCQYNLLLGVPFKFVSTNLKGGNFFDE